MAHANYSADNPGPGAYYSNYNQVLREAPKPSFGLQTKLWANKARTGPGTYNLRRDSNESPKYTMRKHLTRHGTKVPGPGTYHPILKHTNIQAPAYSMQGRTDYNRERGTPGPGTYNAEEHGHKVLISVGRKFKPPLGMAQGPKGHNSPHRPSGSHGNSEGQQHKQQVEEARGSSSGGEGGACGLRSAGMRGPLFRMSRRFFSFGVADPARRRRRPSATASTAKRPRGHALPAASSRGGEPPLHSRYVCLLISLYLF